MRVVYLTGFFFFGHSVPFLLLSNVHTSSLSLVFISGDLFDVPCQADKLTILNEMAAGLLSRVHTLMHSAQPKCISESPEIDSFIKQLVKKYPELPEKIETLKGAPQFKAKAAELTSELHESYLTLVDVLHFSQEAWKLLKDMSVNISVLSFDINIDIMRLYLDLFVQYVQLIILTSRASNVSFVVSAFCYCMCVEALPLQFDLSCVVVHCCPPLFLSFCCAGGHIFVLVSLINRRFRTRLQHSSDLPQRLLSRSHQEAARCKFPFRFLLLVICSACFSFRWF